jgi:hypothetical protein
MRPIRSITRGVVILVLAALAGCVFVPVGGGGQGGGWGYRHEGYGHYSDGR